MSKPTLTLENLTLSRGGVRRLSAQFGAGLHLIAGPNGVGKTSLLNSIVGALKPLEGQILVDGVPVARSAATVVLAPGSPPHLPWLRARLLLEFILSLYPRTRRDSDYRNRILQELGLPSMLENDFGRLSAGTSHKVLLAAALIAAPPVLLFDEPTNELDRRSAHALMSLFVECAVDHVVLVTTHHVAAFEGLCTSKLELKVSDQPN